MRHPVELAHIHTIWMPEVICDGIFFYEIKFCFSFDIICIADGPTFLFSIQEKASRDVKMIRKRSCECATYGTNSIVIYSLVVPSQRSIIQWCAAGVLL